MSNQNKPTPEPTLAQYIAEWIEEEYIRQNVMDIPMEISSYMIQDAIDAYMGGAR